MSDTTNGLSVQARKVTCGNAGVPVLHDVNLDIAAGEFLALIGTNGSGKSTLIRALAGLREPMAGDVFVDGKNLKDISPRQRGRMIAMVTQDEKPNEDLLIGEMVALGLIPYRNPWSGFKSTDRELVEEALAKVGLEELIDRPIGQTSGGERRRAILARGLLQKAPLLFLDEPTNHLDVEQQLALLSLVKGLNRTVIAAIHDLDLAAAYFDRVALVHNGTITAIDEPFTLLTGEDVHQAFRIRVTEVAHPHTLSRHLLFDSECHPRPSSNPPKEK